MSEPLKLDREALAVLVAIAERIARKRQAEKLEQRANLRVVKDKAA